MSTTEELNVTEVATPVAASRFASGFAGADGDDSGGSGEPTPDSSSGGGDDGSRSGSDGGDAFAQERERMQATIRQLQSDRDSARAEAAKLKSGSTEQDGGAGGGTKDPGLTAEQVLSLMRRERTFATAEASLRERFPYADTSIFERSLDFDSVEALSTAVQQSHDSIKARAAQALEAEKEELLRPYIEKYGPLQTTPPGNAGGTNTGDPTPAELMAMNALELDALEQANPGVIERVRRSA